MLERRVQTADHFRSRFEQRLRFGLVDFAKVAPQVIDQFSELSPNIRGMRPRIF